MRLQLSQECFIPNFKIKVIRTSECTKTNTHRLSLGYGSKNLGNGRGFSCVVMGSGGLTRSDPFQLGRLSAGEDSKNNSVILDCPNARQGRRVVGGQVAGARESAQLKKNLFV